MNIDKINKQRIKREKYLGNYGVLGHFDFFSTIITLNSLNNNDLEGLFPHIRELNEFYFGDGTKGINFDLYKKLSKLNPLAFHEYTHFIDFTSTLWGMKFLKLMDDGYQIIRQPQPGDEENFFKAKQFFDFVRHIRLPKYYTEITNNNQNKKPWLYKESIGHKFDQQGHITNEPIIFIRFMNSNGELLARSPISALSILECSSTAQEIEQEVRLLQALDGEERFVEQPMFLQKCLEQLYDKNRTEYSVCAHLLANKIRLSDINVVYNFAGILCRVVLNFPDKLFEKINTHQSIPNEVILDDESRQRLYIGLKNKDLGVLYFLFCKLIEYYDIDLMHKDPQIWVNEILEKIDLNIDQIKTHSHNQIINTKLQISTIYQIFEAGVSNYKKIDWFKPYIEINKLALPPCYLGDGSSVNFFQSEFDNGIEGIDLDNLYNEMYSYESKLLNFTEACG